MIIFYVHIFKTMDTIKVLYYILLHHASAKLKLDQISAIEVSTVHIIHIHMSFLIHLGLYWQQFNVTYTSI